jgi:hypothetical protein
MTSTTDKDSPFKILMHTEVGDAIEYALSPMDGAVAVAQVYDQLPKLHRPRWWHRLIPNHTRLYRAELGWAGVGIVYVQLGDTLHVLDGGGMPAGFRPDIVLPEADVEDYLIDQTDHGGGVSVLTIG